MSVLEAFEARLLGPLTYHSVPDAGAAGGTVTAPFIGDTALTYGIHHSVHGFPLPFRFGPRGPDYPDDYGRFATICSVAFPSGPVALLSPEYLASSFMSEGYEQKAISSMDSKHRRSKVSSTPWRPWRQIQSLAPSEGRTNVFRFIAVSRASLPRRFTVRVGAGRGCLVEIRQTEVPGACDVNRQTVETFLGRSMEGVPHTSRESPLAQFQVYRGVPIDIARRLLEPVAV